MNNVKLDDRVFTITLPEKFTFEQCKEVLGKRHSIPDCIRTIIVDFSQVTYMDSAALGSLLMLRESAKSKSAEIELCHPNEAVKQVLDIANFSKLFKITI